MPTWTIFPQNEKRYAHPMQMNVFQVMKTAYHMLYPSKEPFTIEEISLQLHLTIKYMFSEQNPGPPDPAAPPLPKSSIAQHNQQSGPAAPPLPQSPDSSQASDPSVDPSD
ncbi:hypothetical protein BDR05DRAFT_1002667 [Suillus weaverae]|nr:hypothetical protein BDR05DRAFT_1002667 [Suillus weaverae]